MATVTLTAWDRHQELRLDLDSCLRAELVVYSSNSLLQCVQYREGAVEDELLGVVEDLFAQPCTPGGAEKLDEGAGEQLLVDDAANGVLDGHHALSEKPPVRDELAKLPGPLVW